jgi:hypothetical protein
MADIKAKIGAQSKIKAIVGSQNKIKVIPTFGEVSFSNLIDVDQTNKNDKYVLMYDADIRKVKFVNPDDVLSASSTLETNRPGLPSDFLNTLDVDLDNRIDIDAGEF